MRTSMRFRLIRIGGHGRGAPDGGGSQICDRRRAPGRYNGMTNIPSLSLVGRDGAALGPVEFFYVVGGLLYLSLMLCVALTRSSFGRILQGIRENEPRMELLGYDAGGNSSRLSFLGVAGSRGRAFRELGELHQPGGLQPAAGRGRGHLGPRGRTRHRRCHVGQE
jgi:hypothetical protein